MQDHPNLCWCLSFLVVRDGENSELHDWSDMELPCLSKVILLPDENDQIPIWKSHNVFPDLLALGVWSAVDTKSLLDFPFRKLEFLQLFIIDSNSFDLPVQKREVLRKKLRDETDLETLNLHAILETSELDDLTGLTARLKSEIAFWKTVPIATFDGGNCLQWDAEN